ncbi:hypothetical protein [Amycolatopsis vastitatis]|uniref:hypothetical protein n=1 Tax=Amycolatopsis vastitatis TaxID=1905142 RepID=UPI0013040DF6|nr:hypothetical protein [Amycolatopsis vastitatis]
MQSLEQKPTPAPEQGLAEELADPQPAPGSYWATHEIVRRTPEEIRRGEAPAYVRRIS